MVKPDPTTELELRHELALPSDEQILWFRTDKYSYINNADAMIRYPGGLCILFCSLLIIADIVSWPWQNLDDWILAQVIFFAILGFSLGIPMFVGFRDRRNWVGHHGLSLDQLRHQKAIWVLTNKHWIQRDFYHDCPKSAEFSKDPIPAEYDIADFDETTWLPLAKVQKIVIKQYEDSIYVYFDWIDVTNESPFQIWFHEVSKPSNAGFQDAQKFIALLKDQFLHKPTTAECLPKAKAGYNIALFEVLQRS